MIGPLIVGLACVVVAILAEKATKRSFWFWWILFTLSYTVGKIIWTAVGSG